MANKRKKLMISNKLNVISEVDAHPNVPCIEMANRLGIPPSTLSKIMLSKEKTQMQDVSVGHRPRRAKRKKT
jgi:hypothetical protein